MKERLLQYIHNMSTKTILSLLLNRRLVNPRNQCFVKEIPKYPFGTHPLPDFVTSEEEITYLHCDTGIELTVEVFVDTLAHVLRQSELGARVESLHIVTTEMSRHRPEADHYWFIIQVGKRVLISGPTSNYGGSEYRDADEQLRGLFDLLSTEHGLEITDNEFSKGHNPFRMDEIPVT